MELAQVQTIVSIALGIAGLVGIIFTIYGRFTFPQASLEKKQALDELEADNKSEVLAQQLQWARDATDKRFMDMQLNLNKSLELALNHSHEVALKVDTLTTMFNAMNLETTKNITELKTIIQERFKKT